VFGAHGDLNVLKYFSGRFSLDYSIYASNKDKILQAVAAPGVQATITGLNVNVFSISLNGLGKIPTGSMVTPYGLLGFGIHILSISDGKAEYQGQTFNLTTGLGSQTKFGLNFGAGSEFAVGALKLFFEFKYVLVFTEGSSTGLIPLVVGVTVGG
jgi:opacity protein-like surface antigen